MLQLFEMDSSINEKIERTEALNTRLKSGTPLYDLLDDVRAYERPIVVDLNNTLVGNKAPYEVNSDANDALNRLRQVGTVFIVTAANDWESTQQAIYKAGLWKDDLILVVWPNYAFTNKYYPESADDPNEHDLRTAQIVNTYLNTNPVGKTHTPDDFTNKGPLEKALAPVFNKPWNVPIIDDALLATRNNPGMLGISVQPFDTAYKSNAGTQLPSLSQAAQQVVDYYNK